ncbi:MAG TPA: hypothetical protein VJB90_00285 [Candidatus Nanoarchaeia archaeon]|nr:hypothetical protein [Candidatus Nanoarchaeia archaeon]
MKLAVFAILLFLMPLSLAHLEGGQDVAVNGFIVDFGYDPANPQPGKLTVLAFNLVNEATGETIEPQSVWIRISEGEKVVFAGTFFPQIKYVDFSYAFPKAEKYAIDVKFFNGTNLLAENTFDIEVSGNKVSPFSWVVGAVLAGLIIFFVVRFIRK